GNVLIATGSSPKSLPGSEVDGTFAMTSDEALEMQDLPTSMLIVGGGVIAIECASLLADFGVQITVIEYLERILPSEDEDIAKQVERMLAQKGSTFIKGAKVLPETVTKENGSGIGVEVDGEKSTYEADKLLISVGRQANTS